MKYTPLTVLLLLLLLQAPAQEQKPFKRLADEHYARYEYAEAAVRYKDLIKRKKKAGVHLIERLASCYLQMNKYNEAAAWYAKAITYPDAKVVDWLYYGDMLKSLGHYDEAVTQYQQYTQKGGSQQEKVQQRIAGCEAAKNWLASPTHHLLQNAAYLNTHFADWGAGFYKNGIMVYISDSLRKDELDRRSKRNRTAYGWNRHAYAKLYQATTQRNGAVAIKDFSPAFNQYKYHIGPVVFTKNADTAYFTVTDPRNNPGFQREKYWPIYGTRRLELYTAIYKDAWEAPVPFAYNKPAEYSLGHAALSPDGNVLYFASDMPGGQGATDIWYCGKQSDGHWAPPKNCGPAINTREEEAFPTMNADGQLYFSSKGHIGMGGFDIFQAQGQKDQWSNPVNLQAPRNSPGDDFYYVTSPDKTFLSSNRPGGKGDDDIYSLLSPTSFTALTPPETILQIKLETRVCPSLRGACIYLYNKQRDIGWCFMPADGEFSAMLETETDYVIRVYMGGALQESINVDTHGLTGPQVLNRTVCK